MESKLGFFITILGAFLILEEAHAAILKPTPAPVDPNKVLTCNTKNETEANKLYCCANLPIQQGVCGVIITNTTSGRTTGLATIALPKSANDTLTLIVNSTGIACKNLTSSSAIVCMNITTFNKNQVCFSVSAKNESKTYQSYPVCASLPSLNVNSTTGMGKRALSSSLSTLTMLGGLTSTTDGLGQALGYLAIFNSIPGLSSLISSTGGLGQALRYLAIFNSIPGLSGLSLSNIRYLTNILFPLLGSSNTFSAIQRPIGIASTLTRSSNVFSNLGLPSGNLLNSIG